MASARLLSLFAVPADCRMMNWSAARAGDDDTPSPRISHANKKPRIIGAFCLRDAVFGLVGSTGLEPVTPAV